MIEILINQRSVIMVKNKYWKWLLSLILLAGVVAGGLVSLCALNANAAGNDVTITFNAEKYGSYNSTQTLEAGSEIGIAVDAAEPPYIGYNESLIFYGWSLTDGGSDRVDGSMTVNSDTTLYAIFKKKSDSHTITWNSGTADSPSINKDDDVFIGDTLIPFLDPQNTQPGMYFDGWVKCADDTWKNCDSTRFDFVNAKVTGDMYFMATWKQILFPLMWNLKASSNNALIHKTGSEWDLLDSNNKVLLHVVDNGENDADPDAGELRVNDVPLSTAKVVQTKKVDGFKLLSKPLTVYLYSDGGNVGHMLDYWSRVVDAGACKNDEHDYCPKDSDVQSTWYSKQNLTGDVIDSSVIGGSGKQFYCFYLYEGYTLNPVVGAKFYYTATDETLTSDSNGKLCVNTVTSRKFSSYSGMWDSHFKSALINVDSSVESNLYGRVYAIRFEQTPRGGMEVYTGVSGVYSKLIMARFSNGGRLLRVRYYYPEYVSHVPLDSTPPVKQDLPFTVNFSPNARNWYYLLSVKATLTDGDASKVFGLDSNSEVKLEGINSYGNKKLAGNLTGVEFSAPGVYKFSVVQTTEDFDRWQIDRTPDEITVTVSTNDDGTLSAKLTGTADFTNVYQEPRAVSWLKVDADDASVKLTGSEWTLANADGSFNKSIVDNGENDADPDAGELTVNDVPWGSYSLTETKAPADYEKLSASLTVIVDADGFRITGDGVSSVNNVFNVANKHVPLMTGFLPMTGRNAVFTVIAVAIMASVVAVLVMRKHD